MHKLPLGLSVRSLSIGGGGGGVLYKQGYDIVTSCALPKVPSFLRLQSGWFPKLRSLFGSPSKVGHPYKKDP